MSDREGSNDGLPSNSNRDQRGWSRGCRQEAWWPLLTPLLITSSLALSPSSGSSCAAVGGDDGFHYLSCPPLGAGGDPRASPRTNSLGSGAAPLAHRVRAPAKRGGRVARYGVGFGSIMLFTESRHAPIPWCTAIVGGDVRALRRFGL